MWREMGYFNKITYIYGLVVTNMMQNQTNIDRANVIAKPPRLFLAAVIIGGVLQLIWPLAVSGNLIILISGILLICSGIGLMMWSDWKLI